LYSRFQLIKKYLRYYLTASSGKGHGIHSPFVFNFVQHVLHNQREFEAFHTIGALRTRLLNNNDLIGVQDFGAGSSSGLDNQRTIAAITRQSAKNKKMGQLLFRIAQHYKPSVILELGTSLGLSTAYLASGYPESKVFTIEGAPMVGAMAKNNLDSLGLERIDIRIGEFDSILPGMLDQIPALDLVFIDGNHQKQPTMNYFDWVTRKANSSAVIILDDIHWSGDMEEAWRKIQEDSRVMLTVDLFFMGLVFFNKSFLVKQHFTIRF
jgi:predicted O-methyltransferase YrrM